MRTNREQVRVPTRHEEVNVERVPVEGREASEAEIGGDKITMPVTEEEVVVEKRPVVKEELRIREDAVQNEEVVEEDVRREEVDVDRRRDRERGGEKGKRLKLPSQKRERRKSARGEKNRGETKTL